MSRGLEASRPVALLVAAACAACAGPPRTQSTGSDPRAVRIADQVIAALGGRARWDALVGLEWTFETAVGDTLRPGRRHAWNKHTGWHRVEGTNRQGIPFVFLNQLDSGEGRAWMGGAPMVGDTLGKLMRRARSLWINDSYWMLMPYKLRDPGVHLGYGGDTTIASTVYGRLTLRFDHVGDTPGDRYWVYVNRANHRVERWDYVLEGEQPPPETWTWEGWEQHGGLWFPTVHKSGDRTVFTRRITTVQAFPAATFAAP